MNTTSAFIFCILFTGSLATFVTNGNFSIVVSQINTHPEFRFSFANSTEICIIRAEKIWECVGNSQRCIPVDKTSVNLNMFNWTSSNTSEDSSYFKFNFTARNSNQFSLLRFALKVPKMANVTKAKFDVIIANHNWTTHSPDGKLGLSFSMMGHCENAFFNSVVNASFYALNTTSGNTTSGNTTSSNISGSVSSIPPRLNNPALLVSNSTPVTFFSKRGSSEWFILFSKFPNASMVTLDPEFGMNSSTMIGPFANLFIFLVVFFLV